MKQLYIRLNPNLGLRFSQFGKFLLINTLLLLLCTTLFSTTPTATPPEAGDGSAENPYQIANLENLYWIAADNTRWGYHYIQTSDIDASLTSEWTGGAGWTPIGNSTSIYNGSYDGKGFLIDGLFINQPSIDHIGLFGYTSPSTFIKNLGLINVNIIGKRIVGGLVGSNQGTIEFSFSNGFVSSTAGEVGGLAGSNGGTIRNSYSTASVSGTYAGGLVSLNNWGEIINSYATGNVSGDYAGGLVETNFRGTIVDCFWDTETSGITDSDGGTPKNTTEMQTMSTFTDAGWDFTEIWAMHSPNNDGYPYLYWQYDFTWTGNSDSFWSNGGNWNIGSVPGSLASVVIQSSTNDPVISDSRTLKNMEIELGASLTIASSGNLTISDTLTNSAGANGLLIESSSTGTGSLIHNSSGVQATVQRHVPGPEWHIIAPPVSGQEIGNFINSNKIPRKGNDPNYEYAMTHYEENLYGTAGGWADLYTSLTDNTLMAPGMGYLTARNANRLLIFEGELAHSSVNIPITRIANGWNAIGNPFTSAIGVRSDAESTENFLNINGDVLDQDFRALYIYDGGVYKVINGVVTGNEVINQSYIQSGQGFIVKAREEGGTINFTTGMRYHENYSSFFKKSVATPWPLIQLKVSSGENTAETIVAFNPGMTKGLDPGYDAGLYGGDSDFRLYTHLVEGGSDVKFAIQALPDHGFEDMVIPVGFDFAAGGEFTFSASMLRLPMGAYAILEDRQLNIFIDLETDIYTISLDEKSSGTDRFFIHTEYQVTSVEDIIDKQENNLRIYSYGKEVIIDGEIGENAYATVYDLTGRSIKSVRLMSPERNVVRIDGVASGIYIVRVSGKDVQMVNRVFIE